MKRYVFLLAVVLLAGCLGPSTSVKGRIFEASGEPLAGKEVLLIPLSDEDKVAVFGRTGQREVALNNLGSMGMGEKIMLSTAGGKTRWRTETDSEGNFEIVGLEPGKYVLMRMVAGSVIVMGSDEGWIRVDVPEGQTIDLGTVTLLASGDSISEHDTQG